MHQIPLKRPPFLEPKPSWFPPMKQPQLPNENQPKICRNSAHKSQLKPANNHPKITPKRSWNLLQSAAKSSQIKLQQLTENQLQKTTRLSSSLSRSCWGRRIEFCLHLYVVAGFHFARWLTIVYVKAWFEGPLDIHKKIDFIEVHSFSSILIQIHIMLCFECWCLVCDLLSLFNVWFVFVYCLIWVIVCSF